MSKTQRSARQPRAGLTLIELLVAITVLGVLGALLMATRDRSPAPTPLRIEVTQPSESNADTRWQGEISLQETLDRFGYTVNVPGFYHGHQVSRSGSRRVSTASDALVGEQVEGKGEVTFQELCRQSDLGGQTTFGLQIQGGDRYPLFDPSRHSGYRFGRSRREAVQCGLVGTARLYIDYPNSAFGQGPLFSTAADNPGGSAQLIVLPARTGGAWVDEGGNTGHWEGGEDTGDYLLCWEDVVNFDSDYQDLIVLVRGVRPVP